MHILNTLHSRLTFRAICILMTLSLNFSLYANETISITDFGAVPNSGASVMPSIAKAIEYCKGKSGVTISFPKGRYDFWPMAQDNRINRTGFSIFKQNNLTIEGNGSEFIFHERMEVARVDSSSNIVFRNFSVDWDRPYISQAEIVEMGDSYVDVKIDRTKYPYIIENNKLMFIGEGWKMPVLDVYNNAYDKDKHEIVYKTWDSPLSGVFNADATEKEGGVLRLNAKPNTRLEKGTIISLFHLRYAMVGFELRNSKDLILKDINIYHALSHGVLGERCENITMDNTSMLVNEAKGRVFSIIADASHFVHCKGVIKIENCAHTGQGDDFINVHGRNVLITNIIDSRTIEIGKNGYLIREGDEVWFINNKTVQRSTPRTVSSYKVKDARNGVYEISFTEDMPKDVKNGDFVENKTWNAGLELRNCKILKKNRARGILVTTPENVIIENNYFHSAGTAILIEGDLSYWFESGANRNVIIRNNVFDDCLSSGNADGDSGQWGEAVITITPSHKPETDKDIPFHKNITIKDNTFKVFDAPLVRARSVDGLNFISNNIIKTYTYKPYTWQKSAFLLDGCRKVFIKDNKIDPAYTTRDIVMENMRRQDVQAKGFSIIH